MPNARLDLTAAAAPACGCSYMGATAASMPEALIVNQGGKRGNRKTVVANSMLTSTTAPAPKASQLASLASTAQPVGSLALSGELRCSMSVERCYYLQINAEVTETQIELAKRSRGSEQYTITSCHYRFIVSVLLYYPLPLERSLHWVTECLGVCWPNKHTGVLHCAGQHVGVSYLMLLMHVHPACCCWLYGMQCCAHISRSQF
jgi:hypothetical protein